MKTLVTGAAGFIGFHLCMNLVKKGYKVYGIDNINDYYDINLKIDRLKQLGFKKSDINKKEKKTQSTKFKNLFFSKIDIEDKQNIEKLFANEKFDIVCNLASQVGTRHSIKNPERYINTNIKGFFNIINSCNETKVKHFIYASSSSIYGQKKKKPFTVNTDTNKPISIYAATKKTNELIAYTYSYLYNLSVTGIRFFTVYGPWGRPDMAPMLFAEAILNGKPISIFNNGKMSRDFTYIDDIIFGINILLENPPKKNKYNPPYRIENIGNGSPQKLEMFIKEIEKNLGIIGKKKFLPIQQGDVTTTWADIKNIKTLGYTSKTDIRKGVKNFISWFKLYKNKL